MGTVNVEPKYTGNIGRSLCFGRRLIFAARVHVGMTLYGENRFPVCISQVNPEWNFPMLIAVPDNDAGNDHVVLPGGKARCEEFIEYALYIQLAFFIGICVFTEKQV